MEQLKNKLSGEYWSGKRWLAYDMLKRAGWENRLRFFTEYPLAAAWCKVVSGKAGVFRIRGLAEVLARLNGVWQTKYSADERRQLEELIKRRPLSAYKEGIPLELGLRGHRYFPAVWNTEVQPGSAVKSWHVIGRREDGVGRLKTTVCGSYPEFGKSMVAFSGAVGKARAFGQELLLVGRLETWADLGVAELRADDGVVVFYRSRSAVMAGEVPCVPEVEQVNDPTQVLIVRSSCFACHDRLHRAINFFDGGLRKIEPGRDRMAALDFDYFDFDGKEIFGSL